MSATTAVPPSRAIPKQYARPIPCPPPVTMTTFPSNKPMRSFLCTVLKPTDCVSFGVRLQHLAQLRFKIGWQAKEIRHQLLRLLRRYRCDFELSLLRIGQEFFVGERFRQCRFKRRASILRHGRRDYVYFAELIGRRRAKAEQLALLLGFGDLRDRRHVGLR